MIIKMKMIIIDVLGGRKFTTIIVKDDNDDYQDEDNTHMMTILQGGGGLQQGFSMPVTVPVNPSSVYSDPGEDDNP